MMRVLRPLYSIAIVSGLAFGCGLTEEIRSDSIMSISIASGNGQMGEVGTTITDPLSVRVVDKDGSPVVGQIVQFSVVKGTASFSGDSNVPTNTEGVASVVLIFGDEPGIIEVVAELVSEEGERAVLHVLFELVAEIATKPGLQIVSGNNQEGTVLGSLPQPLRVLAEDKNGNAVQMAEIEFVVTQGSSDISVDSPVSTNLNGIADSSVTLGSKAEDIVILATWIVTEGSNENPSVLFVQKARAFVLTFESGEIGCAGEGDPYPPIHVKATDLSGTPLEGIPIHLDVQNGTVVGGMADLPTNSMGIAEFIVQAGSVSGTAAYEDDVIIFAQAIGLGDVAAISPAAPLKVTKHNFLELITENVENPGPFPFIIDFTFEVKALGACDVIKENQSVNFDRRWGYACITAEEDWPFGWVTVDNDVTGADGIASYFETFSWFEVDADLSHQFRASMSGANSNIVTSQIIEPPYCDN